jgi:hypothetical protein
VVTVSIGIRCLSDHRVSRWLGIAVFKSSEFACGVCSEFENRREQAAITASPLRLTRGEPCEAEIGKNGSAILKIAVQKSTIGSATDCAGGLRNDWLC